VETTETATLPVLPLTSGVVLPGMVVTLALETVESQGAADAAQKGDGTLLLVPRIGSGYARVGTVAKLEDVGNLVTGLRAVVVRGIARAVIGVGAAGTGAVLFVDATPVEEAEPTERAHELVREFKATVEAILEHHRAGRMADLFSGITDPGQIADTAAYWPDLAFERKVEVLETVDVEARIEKVLGWAKESLAELELKARIRNDVNGGMEKQQREFMLRQQLAAIQKELGQDGDGTDVVGGFRVKLEELGEALPTKAREYVGREIDRFERMSDQSPEHGWIRTWLEWVFDVPWGTVSDDDFDLGAARAVLDADHTGLDEVKERIVEHLAVRKLRVDRGLGAAPTVSSSRRGGGAILTLVGPPGVGKTSLGESIARSLGRKFVRVALGGVRDEAEIRGHRRTYVGAMPGRLVRAMKEAGTMNPVVLLDEVDKLGNDWRGDPSSALLEVLDPAQNHTFSDHYLEVELDLSDVLFLATANVMETIPEALQDRMEIVRLDGYTEDEKVAIARDHLLRRQLDANALTDEDVRLTDDAIRSIVRDHTREAGVRSLERQLGKVLRKAATKVAAGAVEPPLLIDDLHPFLGRPRFVDEIGERTSVPGVATGLAVTGIGGDILFVEATSMPGPEGASLTVTGQLGEVMKESAQIALSFVRSHAEELGVDATAFENRRFHVHFPAGAVPKDGPSAGVTMTTALVSLLTGRLVNPALAMTGEVTLRGKVLPIGGVKQKVMAAHRHGLTEVVLPARNEPDLDDLPDAVRAAMTIHLAADVRDVLALALEPAIPLAGSEVDAA
jgi:ATP-dependent Lon protease